MKNIKFLWRLGAGLVFLMWIGLPLSGNAQQADSLMMEIRSLGELSDPAESKAGMERIINQFELNAVDDAETIDMMKGHVAMDYLDQGNYKRFNIIIKSMANKFNQTSYMNMAVSRLLDGAGASGNRKALKKAESIAKKTLKLYDSFKDDPSARPAGFAPENWDRFMTFAYYPYNDAYAAALYARGKYKKALQYQEKAFDGDPKEGMGSSVQRYAHLLALNGEDDKAYDLLVSMAESGKSTIGMDELLEKLYIQKHGGPEGYESFISGLQGNVVETLKEELQEKMLDRAAPDFALRDLEGNTVRLADFRGQSVVIDFWATWCAPCKASFPAMVKAQEQHPDIKFLFIATQEKPEGAEERVRDYIQETEYPFHVLMDESSPDNPRAYQVVSAYEVTGIPTKIFIDAEGRIRFVSVGFSGDSELLNEMEAMLALMER